MASQRLPSGRSVRIAFALTCSAMVLSSAPLKAQDYWGQSFTAPSGPNLYLQSVSVSDEGLQGNSGNMFTAQIFAFDGGGWLSGSSLFSQDLGPEFAGFTLSPNITLSSGQMYAVLVNQDGGMSISTYGDFYAGGSAVRCNAAKACVHLFDADDDVIGFSLGFGSITTTPEPGSMALLGLGLAFMVPVLRRRRR